MKLRKYRFISKIPLKTEIIVTPKIIYPVMSTEIIEKILFSLFFCAKFNFSKSAIFDSDKFNKKLISHVNLLLLPLKEYIKLH